MVEEQRGAGRFVGRFQRLQVRVERHFRVDDDVLAPRKPDDDIGPEPPVVGRR